MKFPSRPIQHSTIALNIALLVASLSGCASPGPARPPSLHLARPVTNLTAVRTGDDVVLHWTSSDKTTDGLKLPSTFTAEVCRESKPSATCTPLKRVTVHPGPAETSETLPSNFTTGPATLLTYRVSLLNANGHSAGLSTPAFAAAGVAPPPIEHLRVTPVRGGAMLQWQAQSSPSLVELSRTLVQTTASPRPKAKQPLQPTSAPAEIHLRTGSLSIDSGGTIDSTAQRGETYRYTAQRVLPVTLDGHSLELRSTPSSTITAVMNDAFPPKPPSRLAAIPSPGTIDLSWEPNIEPDLAGYIVYRQPVTSNGATTGTPARLTPTPIQTPAFSDHTAQPGQTYSYRITAIDTTGNESPASNEARESLRNQ